ncbi:NADH dehydrogenase [ubiquinone] 1 beta subcomplex subunit 2, mitochondrial [Teleopsis dalmanni]|uniref:NADH dehydrogenase [ubiquinone] 1 beta subcomplex subunit 2, mitochondrial n=1 Tax=Teleopsis dalmanni TaxID=139649 RepID=UPI0018CC93CD|nr:NADH dehydrogenase [ubiquinone] 1 beta subcomplex subunit 2, mitochondrial [Teleopsis dalmanni]
MFYRKILTLLKPSSRYVNIHSIRKSHAAYYRRAPDPPGRSTIIGAEVAGAAMWWWILWHLWHEHEHITGEFPYPDTSQWTNAELGIPADES